MKKRLVIYCAAGLLFYAGFLTYCYFSDGVTRSNYLRIKTGLTKSEITTMLGGSFGIPDHTQKEGLVVIETWQGTEGTIFLTYDAKDQIIWKEWDDTRRKQGALDRLLRMPRVVE
jgi:hypothetical protein